MLVRFYGVRGSIPTPLSSEEYTSKLKQVLRLAGPNDLATPQAVDDFIAALPFYLRGTYGGNTACVYLNIDGTQVVLDMGSGFRLLGFDLLTKDFGKDSDDIYVFLSHTHWDHIQGLPFFIPAYLEGNTLHIHSPASRLEERLAMQQYAQYFPVTLDEMGARFRYYKMDLGQRYGIRNFTVACHKLNHPNNSYAYRIEYGGKVVVYATDTEFTEQGLDFLKGCIDFFRGADVLILDAQYTYKESYFEKIHYGHSSANTCIDIALKSEARRVVFFHHEPTYRDEKLFDFYKEVQQYHSAVARRLDLELIPAYEGLEIRL